MSERLWLKRAPTSRLASVRLCCLRTIAIACQQGSCIASVKSTATYIWQQSWYPWRWYFSVSLFQPSTSPFESPSSSRSYACWIWSSFSHGCRDSHATSGIFIARYKKRQRRSSSKVAEFKALAGTLKLNSTASAGREQGSRLLLYTVYI